MNEPIEELIDAALAALSDVPDPPVIFLGKRQAADKALVAGLRKIYPGVVLYRLGRTLDDQPEIIN